MFTKLKTFKTHFKNFLSFINLPCGHVMSHKKCGPDWFSRFDVYWIQTNKQTPKQTDKPNLYMDKTRKFWKSLLLINYIIFIKDFKDSATFGDSF